MHSTAALNQMGFANLLQQADGVALGVLILLLLMAVFSWYYILTKSMRAIALRGKADGVIGGFWDTASLPDGVTFLEKQPKSEPFSKVALESLHAARHHQQHTGGRLGESMSRSEFVERALRRAIARETGRLETGLTFLATVGSTAPFVGLFGTVWGIYHALIRIGASGEASLDAVAAPVGEALIMTALGLAVAVPAVLGYNFLVRSNSVVIATFDSFAHDLHQFLTTGARVDAPAPAAKK
ncbi:MAG TPA: MotA/TolQ/ExbB proton channel family protein [Candidatus Binatia bacterium]|nr:MotA/TolQ/ExbB proton channel family protein [Candidatus Binatia bacterium]